MRSPHFRLPRVPRFIAAVSIMALSVLGVGFIPSPAFAATHSVSLQNLQYNPATLTVNVGDSVTWTNNDTVTHSVTGGPLNSPDLNPGATYSVAFSSPITIDYHCRFHPDMVGRLIVQDGNPPPTTTPPTTTPPGTTPPTTSPGGGATPTTGGGGAPVGVGPLPVAFNLGDANGSWFNTNLNLGPSIGQSLAVAVLPRVNLGSLLNGVPNVNPAGVPLVGGGGLPDIGGLLPGGGGLPNVGGVLPGGGGLPDVGGLLPGGGSLPNVGGLLPGLGDIPLLGGGSLPLIGGGTVPLLGGGLLSGLDAAKTLNTDLVGQLTKLNLGSAGGVPLLGNLGVSPNSLLNLDATRQAITQLLPTGDARLTQASTLLDQLVSQVSALPVNAPISLKSLPAGAELDGLLANLRSGRSPRTMLHCR